MAIKREFIKDKGIVREEFDLPTSRGTNLNLHFNRPVAPSNGTVTLNAIGWTETSQSISPFLEAQAMGSAEYDGVTAMSFTHDWSAAPNEVLTAGSKRAERIAQVFEFLREEYDEVNITGHSLGGIDVTKAIIENKLSPNVLALIASAGLIRGDNFRRVAPGVFKEILKQEQHFREDVLNEAAFAWQSLLTVIRNPALTFKEGLYAARSYVAEHVGDIYQDGTVIGVVVPERDKIFPMENVLASTDSLSIDERLVIDACHNPTYHNSQELAEFLLGLINRQESIRVNRTDWYTQDGLESELMNRMGRGA